MSYQSIINYYTTRANATDCHVKPTAGIDCGVEGKALEVLTEYALVSRAYKVKKPTAKADIVITTANGKLKVEVKSGCGELATYTANGDVKTAIWQADYVIYIPEYIAGADIRHIARVFPAMRFDDLLEDAGLTRYKRSSYAVKHGFTHYDKKAIQSFKNSVRATERMYDIMDKGMTIDEFLSKIGRGDV